MRFISDSPRARVLQFRELHEHVGHLVAALAATDVDDDVGIGPLGQLVLHDRLAAAKRAGHGGHAALGHREQRVDDALASDHRLGRRQLFGVRAAAADRPTLQHGQLDGLAILLQPGNRLHDVGFAGVDPRQLAGDAGRHHDLVQHGFRLLDGAQHVACAQLVAHLRDRDKVPEFFMVERIDDDAARNAVARLLAHDVPDGR